MSDAEGNGQIDVLAALQARADMLEKQLLETEARTQNQLRQSELKSEAMRAGIVDIDGLRLLDAEAWMPARDTPAIDAAEVIGRLRRAKPWLFGATQSSSAANPPAAAPVRRKLATDMSLDEWRAARADLLRKR